MREPNKLYDHEACKRTFILFPVTNAMFSCSVWPKSPLVRPPLTGDAANDPTQVKEVLERINRRIVFNRFMFLYLFFFPFSTIQCTLYLQIHSFVVTTFHFSSFVGMKHFRLLLCILRSTCTYPRYGSTHGTGTYVPATNSCYILFPLLCTDYCNPR